MFANVHPQKVCFINPGKTRGSVACALSIRETYTCVHCRHRTVAQNNRKEQGETQQKTNRLSSTIPKPNRIYIHTQRRPRHHHIIPFVVAVVSQHTIRTHNHCRGAQRSPGTGSSPQLKLFILPASIWKSIRDTFEITKHKHQLTHTHITHSLNSVARTAKQAKDLRIHKSRFGPNISWKPSANQHHRASKAMRKNDAQ